ncbi:protein FAR-RED IMPAIRED RESPONSE 1-like isoform X2 [Rhododendron vialii]|uniref:protein FAR-RED IMPAIRED RESPONSE 1-like isoform X2 n=1 Tax=Rhododendron vialii TaxID=182163 RepID=UPI00265FE17B|nr:protein FAR-RED IMPAIRED RESPONSE 1-like isoform X2 [Rhododendron vialii]
MRNCKHLEVIMMGIDLEQPSREHHKEDCGPLVDVNRDVATVNSNTENDKQNARPNVSSCMSNSGEKGHTTNVAAVDSITSMEPHGSMEFNSKEDAFSFYKEYAKSIGFATITKASRRSRITGKFIDAKFVCARYGSKREPTTSETPEPASTADSTLNIPNKKKRGRISQSWSKTDCKACMHVKRTQDGRWVIRSFTKEHNHEILSNQAYYYRGHRNIDQGNSNLDALHSIRARTKTLYVKMSRQSGGVKKVSHQKSGPSNCSQQNLPLDGGDAQAMVEYFIDMQDENPNFFYALDFNEEQRLRNVFWVDAKGRLDYGSFDDVVVFDTTYIKNEYKLPLAPFIGVNNHCQSLLLGCALVADETKSSYSWVMRSWLRAMGKQSPKVILTDQDKDLKEAIAEVFPNARHRYCLCHILSKIPENLSYVLRQHENFMTKFNKCIFKSSIEEKFEKRWWKMVDGFNLKNDVWLQTLYEDRERWIPTYMRDVFLAGMSPTQRSESLSSVFDKCMHRKTSLRDFLDQYRAILQDKCEEEAKADFDMWHKQPGLKSPSPFGKQMATIYTHAIFKKFQVEVLGVVACHPKKESGDDGAVTFKVQDFEDNNDCIVVWNEMTSDISCSCRLFEYNGFLCRHVMIVLQMSGVHDIPSQYILKRWTKDAKGRQMRRQGSGMVESRDQRYNNLCQRAFKLGDEGSLSQESYNIAFNALEKALKKCESVNNSIQSVLDPGSPSVDALHDFDEGTQAKKSIVSKEGNEQLNARVPALDGCFGTQQIMQGMGDLNSMPSSRDDYYSNQQSMQGLGQLNSIAPLHNGHYMTPQRLHGLGRLPFGQQSIQNCFDIQDTVIHDCLDSFELYFHGCYITSAYYLSQDQSDVGSTHIHGMASKHFPSKHLSQ